MNKGSSLNHSLGTTGGDHMSNRLGVLVAIVAIVFGLTAPGAQAEPIAANFNACAHAAQVTLTTVCANPTWGVLGSPLSYSIDAVSGAESSYSDGTSSWGPGGDSGTFTMDAGWIVGAQGESVSSTDIWYYDFIADATGTFTFDWDVTTTPSYFGLAIYTSIYPLPQIGFDLNTSGQATGTVIQGQGYAFEVEIQPNVSGNIYPSLSGEEETGVFSFTLPGAPEETSVPEPSSLVLLGSGVLSLAGAVRRKLRP